MRGGRKEKKQHILCNTYSRVACILTSFLTRVQYLPFSWKWSHLFSLYLVLQDPGWAIPTMLYVCTLNIFHRNSSRALPKLFAKWSPSGHQVVASREPSRYLHVMACMRVRQVLDCARSWWQICNRKRAKPKANQHWFPVLISAASNTSADSTQ